MERTLPQVRPTYPMLCGISGLKGSGKSTLARLLIQDAKVETANVVNYKQVSFANTLKEMAAVAIGCSRVSLDDETFKQQPVPFCPDVTVRKVLQILGTEVGRQLNENFWINRTFASWRPNMPWVIDDVRFPNEVKAIQDRGGIVIRINAAGLDKDDLHPSEIALNNFDGFDYTIFNEKKGTEILHAQLLEILTS